LEFDDYGEEVVMDLDDEGDASRIEIALQD